MEIIQEGISHSTNSLQTGLQHVFEMSSAWNEAAHGAEMSWAPLCNSQIPLAIIIPSLAQRWPYRLKAFGFSVRPTIPPELFTILLNTS